MTYDQKNLLLLNLYIFNRHNRLSLRDAAIFASSLGYKASHEYLSQKFRLIDAIGVKNWWQSLIQSNFPQAFIRLEEAQREASKDDSHRLTHLTKLPVKFALEVLPRLKPADPKKVERLLAKKICNARSIQKINLNMDIADSLIAFAVFRELVSEGAFISLDPDNLWPKKNGKRHFALCRLRDQGAYSLDNCAFRPQRENSSYARSLDSRATRDDRNQRIQEIDKSMEQQIARQLELRQRVLGK